MIWALLFLLFTGCTSQMTSWNEEKPDKIHLAIEDLRIEMADVKHAINGAKVDLQLLEEKVSSSKAPTKSGDVQLAAVERKLAELQKNQEKITADLRQLAAHANQTSTTFVKQQEKMKEIQQEILAQNHRIEEVVKLKGTLSSLSQVLKEKSSGQSSSSYKIKSGDSLEKIAKQQGTTVEAIKKLNELTSDRIVVGQEIQLPDE